MSTETTYQTGTLGRFAQEHSDELFYDEDEVVWLAGDWFWDWSELALSISVIWDAPCLRHAKTGALLLHRLSEDEARIVFDTEGEADTKAKVQSALEAMR